MRSRFYASIGLTIGALVVGIFIGSLAERSEAQQARYREAAFSFLAVPRQATLQWAKLQDQLVPTGKAADVWMRVEDPDMRVVCYWIDSDIPPSCVRR